MIQSNVELYRYLNNIIDTLKKAKQLKYAKKLEDALSISTVTSEVLGETRLVLNQIKSNLSTNELNIQQDVQLSLKYLDRIL